MWCKEDYFEKWEQKDTQDTVGYFGDFRQPSKNIQWGNFVWIHNLAIQLWPIRIDIIKEVETKGGNNNYGSILLLQVQNQQAESGVKRR